MDIKARIATALVANGYRETTGPARGMSFDGLRGKAAKAGVGAVVALSLCAAPAQAQSIGGGQILSALGLGGIGRALGMQPQPSYQQFGYSGYNGAPNGGYTRYNQTQPYYDGGYPAGIRLSPQDVGYAQNAAQNAMETPLGTLIRWRNPQTGSWGSYRSVQEGVTANGTPCRRVDTVLSIRGQPPRQVGGFFCNIQDQGWRRMSDADVARARFQPRHENINRYGLRPDGF